MAIHRAGMSDDAHNEKNDSAASWIRETLNRAVREITNQGVFDGEFVEARPVWSLPERVLIGQIRETDEQAAFQWIICGDFPTDHIASTVASTPREALRHFSLKWQLDAGDSQALDEHAENLVARAEQLYEMVADDSLWQEPGGG